MEETKDKRYKILVLSDHALSHSGVGTQSGWLFRGLLDTGKYVLKQFGGAIKHANYDSIMVPPFGSDFVVKPVDGFGTPETLRMALIQEQPDVLFLFTDPRFFIWVWEMEEEIHQICPIAYWHVWDNDPAPDFNKVLYDSTDLINCLSHKTYEMCKEIYKDDNKKQINYIPHSLPKEVFRPLEKEDCKKLKAGFFGEERKDWFVVTWIGRNAVRKNPAHLIQAWNLFLANLEKKHGHRNALLCMHTDPLDQEGPNLLKNVEHFKVNDRVMFSTEKAQFDQMNVLHNVSDVNIAIACAEGFGLPTCEAMYTGKPIIAITTGGLTRQVINHKTGEENGVAMKPDTRRLVGTQMCPYIFEDFVNVETIADSIMKIYEMSPEERELLGKRAMEYAHEEFNYEKMISNWDNSLENLIETWKNNKQEVYQPFEVKTL